MSLDAPKSDAELLRLHAARTGRPLSEKPLAISDSVVAPISSVRAGTFVSDPYARMNKAEATRAQELEAKRRAGEIACWWYEALTLRLADDTRYTPDFLVQHTTGQLELEEVKGGFIRDDAAVKIKVAASLYPFRFTMYQRLTQKQGGGWKVTDYTQKTRAA